MELFTTGAVDTLDLRERYCDWWRHWERLGDPTPVKVPRGFATRAICRAPFVIDGLVWEVRVAAVSAVGAEQIAWHSTVKS